MGPALCRSSIEHSYPGSENVCFGTRWSLLAPNRGTSVYGRSLAARERP